MIPLYPRGQGSPRNDCFVLKTSYVLSFLTVPCVNVACAFKKKIFLNLKIENGKHVDDGTIHKGREKFLVIFWCT